MRTSIFLLLLSITTFTFAQGDYVLEIGDTSINISLNNEIPIVVNGEATTIKLTQNDIQVFDDGHFTFEHPKESMPNTADLGEGIEQTMLMTAEGSGYLIQYYPTIDPSFLHQIMMNEITKESVKAGYKKKVSKSTRKLTDGTKVDTEVAVLTYKGSEDIYEITSLSDDDGGGILIVTMSVGEESEDGKALIDLMWDTIELSE